MKIVVANSHQKSWLSFYNWLLYYFCTVNMNPAIFSKERINKTDLTLLKNGLLHIVVGCSILFVLRNLVEIHYIKQNHYFLFWLYSFLALFSLSIILHFGLLSLNTFFLKKIGIPDYPVFKQPFKSKSLSEFWGKRWNLAFSEMTAIAVFKPLTKKWGPKKASFISFMVSGALHEVAISLAVMKGFGLPMLYFVVHGILMTIEKKVFKQHTPGTLWVITSLVLPVMFLFHEYFLLEVVWAIVYFSLDDFLL